MEEKLQNINNFHIVSQYMYLGLLIFRKKAPGLSSRGFWGVIKTCILFSFT